MPGRGPTPKEHRSRARDEKARIRGDWKLSETAGWQHGELPEPPDGLLEASRAAWETWFRAWWAAHWTPEDLPMLRQVIRLYDKVERNDFTAAELAQYRQLLESYGITPKGQQDRRWKPPEAPPKAEEGPSISAYGHLKAVE